MIRIETIGMDAFQRELARYARELGPDRLGKAIAAGINRTADHAEQRLLNAMERDLDRPTPFSLNAIGLYKARPGPRPAALLYIKPRQAKYLRYAIKGGRLPTVIEPVRVRLNRYGNIVGKRPRGLESIAARGARRFVATINGTFGVWERTGRSGRGLKLLAAVRRNAPREPRWDFSGIAMRTAEERLERDVLAAIQAALRG